jgi:hypothetical protein
MTFGPIYALKMEKKTLVGTHVGDTICTILYIKALALAG